MNGVTDTRPRLGDLPLRIQLLLATGCRGRKRDPSGDERRLPPKRARKRAARTPHQRLLGNHRPSATAREGRTLPVAQRTGDVAQEALLLGASSRRSASSTRAIMRAGGSATRRLPKRAAASLASLALPPLLLLRAVQAARARVSAAKCGALRLICSLLFHLGGGRERWGATWSGQRSRDDRVTAGSSVLDMPCRGRSKQGTADTHCAACARSYPILFGHSRLPRSRRSLSVAGGRAREGGAAARLRCKDHDFRELVAFYYSITDDVPDGLAPVFAGYVRKRADTRSTRARGAAFAPGRATRLLDLGCGSGGALVAARDMFQDRRRASTSPCAGW